MLAPEVLDRSSRITYRNRARRGSITWYYTHCASQRRYRAFTGGAQMVLGSLSAQSYDPLEYCLHLFAGGRPSKLSGPLSTELDQLLPQIDIA